LLIVRRGRSEAGIASINCSPDGDSILLFLLYTPTTKMAASDEIPVIQGATKLQPGGKVGP